jgi:hypothetical protein
MLDTLLHIGKILRESGQIKYLSYVERAPRKSGKLDVVYIVLPVSEDFTFNFDKIYKTTHEYEIDELYYLKFKTSKADNQVKYIFGDISYGVDKKGDYLPNTFYQLAEPDRRDYKKYSSFDRSRKEAKFFQDTLVEKFRESFASEKERIEMILQENGFEQICFLHFDFQGDKRHWYLFDNELNKISEKVLEETLKKQAQGYVLDKYIYKTLSSPKDDVKFPQFSEENVYKTRLFKDIDEVMNLFYALEISLKQFIGIGKIKINVLPKGDNLKAEQIEEYFNSKGLGKHSTAVSVIDAYNQPDDFFSPFASEIAKNFTQFDVIFSDGSGKHDVDVIELAGLERDSLVELNERIKDIRREVEAKREKVVGKSDKIEPLRIRQSFSNILGDFSKDNKKYQSHLLKVLPQIYKGDYYRDEVLLPAFIKRTEYNIRQGKTNYVFLKFDYEFLVKLRNKNGDKDMKDMFESPSFKAGTLLGQLAQPVSRKINSFEKNYVGQLSRRISDIDGLMNLAGFICEKLAIHDKAYPELKEKYGEFMSLVKEIQQDYDRRYCIVGFFEGYFSKSEKTEKEETNEGENQ